MQDGVSVNPEDFDRPGEEENLGLARDRAAAQRAAAERAAGADAYDAYGVDPSPDADAPIPALPVAITVRFCKSCGDPWDPSWDACPRCAARGQASHTAATAQAEYVLDRGRVKSALALYFALLSVSIVTIIILLASEAEAMSVGAMIAVDIAMSVITLAWCVASRKELAPQLRRGASAKWLLLAGGLGVPTFILASVIVNTLHRVFDVPQLEYLEGFTSEGYGIAWAVLLICIQPAVFEELGFRGVILSALEPVLGARETLIVSALMFAILHLSIPSIPHLFVLGLLLAWLRQKTGSLLPCMILHFVHNFLVVLSEQYRSVMPW